MTVVEDKCFCVYISDDNHSMQEQRHTRVQEIETRTAYVPFNELHLVNGPIGNHYNKVCCWDAYEIVHT